MIGKEEMIGRCFKIHRNRKGEIYIEIPKSYLDKNGIEPGEYYFWQLSKCFHKAHQKKEKKK